MDNYLNNLKWLLNKVMNIKIKKKYLLLIIFYFSSAMAKFEYEVPMDKVNWIYKGSSLKCSLVFNDTSYGKFIFRSEEIGKINFKINLVKNNSHLEYGQLYSTPEPWSNNNKSKGIGHHVPITKDHFTFHTDISSLLDKITQGSWIKLSLSGNQTSEFQSLLLPTIRIQQPLAQFRRCLSYLPQMPYSIARNITFNFDQGERTLNKLHKQTLKALSTYLHADKSISRILIDGYSDNIGSDLSNLALSKLRADEIASGLIGKGISKEKIQVRSHGSRYPTVSNDTIEGQAKNRRVTIRLVKSDEKIVPQQTQKINDMEEA
ncbi:MotY family protein [Vibrio hepatarius]|uniref:MotY family protein n=1 Tax=Vibrio hepatarius TaxID=171383 RepID=UPI001C0971D6|nr:OmpA family protein [Vibrio hepatarius]MBU2895536.1 OmpA family protein [Vibrio hepatarius]